MAEAGEVHSGRGVLCAPLRLDSRHLCGRLGGVLGDGGLALAEQPISAKQYPRTVLSASQSRALLILTHFQSLPLFGHFIQETASRVYAERRQVSSIGTVVQISIGPCLVNSHGDYA